MIVFSLRYMDVGSNLSESAVDYETASSLLCQSFMQVALVLSTLTILVRVFRLNISTSLIDLGTVGSGPKSRV